MPRKGGPNELDALRKMCREGRLFDVQEWIRQGKPVTPKDEPLNQLTSNGPLRIAMERGFHSLIQVLLEAGAPIELGNYNALQHAVELKRHDLVELLLENGASVDDVSMQVVVESWDRPMIDLFISRGASLTRDNPIAWGLINKIRPALGVLKHYLPNQPELMEQAEIALRYHAAGGNTKWVSLMLWAGADPWSVGPEEVREWIHNRAEDVEDDYHWSAVRLAVLHERRQVLELKGFLGPPDPKRPETLELLDGLWLCRNKYVCQLLLNHGHLPRLLEDRGSDLITRLLCGMGSNGFGLYRSSRSRSETDIDTYETRDQLEIVRMLLSHGAYWQPRDKAEIRNVRQSLLRLKLKYTLEFLQALLKHKAARRRDIEELLRTSSMKSHTARRCRRIAASVVELPEELPTR